MENSSVFTPATKRQLWALYCITKKDYRNENISKDDAAKLIQELGNSDYKKKSIMKDLKTEFLEFMQNKFPKIKEDADDSLNYASEVTVSAFGNENHFAMVGCGCGITYLVFRKNNKKATEINDIALKARFNEVEKMYIESFSKKRRNYYESIGCPLEAIWSQDQHMQITYWSAVIEFMTSKGIKNVKLHTMLD